MENNKINIAEILKNCPSGMKLNSPLVDELYFDCITALNTIKCYTREHNESNQICNSIYFNYDGSYLNHPNSKCVIFPLDKTTWKGFVLHNKFKDGDIVATSNGDFIGITTGVKEGRYLQTYCICTFDNTLTIYPNKKEFWIFDRLATEKEKQKLLKVIEENNYKWNKETKTLENLVSNKFDINTLIPFESKVLVRNTSCGIWTPAIYGGYSNVVKDDYKYMILRGAFYKYLIPYEGNEHLLGTTKDCYEYYKIW